jgi:hypothetical protein
VLDDAVKALRHRVRKVDHSYDIPYVAGYSVDARTVYIDRHLPRTFRSWTGRRIRVEPFILTHEIIEKALLDELRLHYLHAHQIAIRAEQAAVKAAGVSWSAYQRFNKRHEKSIATEHLKRVPKNLDLRPYEDEQDYDVLQRIIAERG